MDKKDKLKIEEYLKTEFTGQKLTDVDIFIANIEEVVENTEGWQLSDSGIQLTFESSKKLSFCFDYNVEIVDIFDKELNSLSEKSKYLRGFNQQESVFWKKFINQEIKELELNFNWYEDFDETVYFVPLTVEITFSNDEKIMFAAVNLDFKDDGTIDINLDSEGGILITFDNEIIKELNKQYKDWEEDDREAVDYER